MTANQRRAIELATQILRSGHADLGDVDWQLLLLAAGLNNVFAHPLVAARRVLDNVAGRRGYFASQDSPAVDALPLQPGDRPLDGHPSLIPDVASPGALPSEPSSLPWV